MNGSQNALRVTRVKCIAYIVMAGLVPAIPSDTGAATDGRDKPGHDEPGIRS
jgi:hypothetical protein